MTRHIPPDFKRPLNFHMKNFDSWKYSNTFAIVFIASDVVDTLEIIETKAGSVRLNPNQRECRESIPCLRA